MKGTLTDIKLANDSRSKERVVWLKPVSKMYNKIRRTWDCKKKKKSRHNRGH